MKMNQSQMNAVKSKLNSVWTNSRNCSICNNDKWTIIESLYEVRELITEGNQNDLENEEKSIVPYVKIVCNNCGHTIFMNALKLGFKMTKPAGGETGPSH